MLIKKIKYSQIYYYGLICSFLFVIIFLFQFTINISVLIPTNPHYTIATTTTNYNTSYNNNFDDITTTNPNTLTNMNPTTTTTTNTITSDYANSNENIINNNINNNKWKNNNKKRKKNKNNKNKNNKKRGNNNNGDDDDISKYSPPFKTLLNNNNNIIINVGPGTTGTHGTYDALCQLGIPSIHWRQVCLSTTKLPFKNINNDDNNNTDTSSFSSSFPKHSLLCNQYSNNTSSSSSSISTTTKIIQQQQQETSTSTNHDNDDNNNDLILDIYKNSIQYQLDYVKSHHLIHEHLYHTTKEYTKNDQSTIQPPPLMGTYIPMSKYLLEYFPINQNNNNNLNNIDVRQWQKFIKHMFKQQLTTALLGSSSSQQKSNNNNNTIEPYIKSFHDMPYYAFITTMIDTINEIRQEEEEKNHHHSNNNNNEGNNNNWNIFFMNSIRNPYEWAIRRIQSHRLLVCKDNLDEIDLDGCINRAIHRLDNKNSVLKIEDVFYSIPQISKKNIIWNTTLSINFNETYILIDGTYDNDDNNNNNNSITLQDLINGLMNGMKQHQERVNKLITIFSSSNNTTGSTTINSNLYTIDLFSNPTATTITTATNGTTTEKPKWKKQIIKEQTTKLSIDLLKHLVFYITKYNNINTTTTNNNNNNNNVKLQLQPKLLQQVPMTTTTSSSSLPLLDEIVFKFCFSEEMEKQRIL